jgi:Transposase DDE domain/Insertion element 4 transposase N-terminal
VYAHVSRQKKHQEGIRMINIDTISTTPQSIIKALNVEPGLPFKELLPTEVIEQAIVDIDYRNRLYTPDVTVWCLLSQALAEDQSLQGSVLRLVASKTAIGEEAPSANTSAYSQARSRLPASVLETLSNGVADNITENISSEWKWRERSPKLIDGSTLSMPDTLENQEKYPQPKTQKKGIGFPLARFVVIICFVTGSVLKFAMDSFSGKETGEHALLRRILNTFNRGDIALGDAYYPSYFLICEFIKRGVDFVFPAHAARSCDFRLGTRLGRKDHIALWNKPSKPDWMDQETYDQYPQSVKIREVEIISERPGFKTKKRTLVTSFLNSFEVSKKDVAELYNFRWFVELDIRAIKSVMKMDILRSKTPEMIEKEIWSHLLAYNLVRRVMVDAAIKSSKSPRQLSFKIALRAVEAFRQQGILGTNAAEYNALLESIVHKKIGDRPGRHEPRMVKRRPKPHKRLQKPRIFYKTIPYREAA